MSKSDKHSKTGTEELSTKPKIRQAPDMVTFYANGARLAFSEYDVRIYFSDQGQDYDSGERLTSVERACIIMAPECAEELIERLQMLLSDYEDLFGRRKKPDEAEAG